MKRIERHSHWAVAVMASGLLVLAVVPAGAQYYYPAPRVYAPAPPPPPAYPSAIGPHDADAIVRSLGLAPVSRALPRGPAYVVHAVGREGSAVQVTIDRYSGRVIHIARLGRSAPRIAALPPGYEAPFDLDDEAPTAEYELPPPSGEYDDDEESSSLPPPVNGPSVITRQGIQSNELPPLPPAQRGMPRESDVTGSVPRGTASGRVDPLLGVPTEFRGEQQRTAARAPETAPRSAPMPRPRPADAPQVARTESVPPPAPKQEPAAAQQKPRAATPVDPERVPDVQGFE
jgi:hypothetical protein